MCSFTCSLEDACRELANLFKFLTQLKILRFSPLDAPPQLANFAKRFADYDYDYGNRGPRNLNR